MKLRRNSYPSSAHDDPFGTGQVAPQPRNRISETLHDPRVQQRVRQVGTGALRGAMEASGVVKDNGRVSKLGVVRAAVNPTGTLRRAARGAVTGGYSEARNQGQQFVQEAAGAAYTAMQGNLGRPAELPTAPWSTPAQTYEQPLYGQPTAWQTPPVNEDPFARRDNVNTRPDFTFSATQPRVEQITGDPFAVNPNPYGNPPRDPFAQGPMPSQAPPIRPGGPGDPFAR